MDNYLRDKSPEDFEYYKTFLNLAEVRKSIHVGNLNFVDGNKTVFQYLMRDISFSSRPDVEYLLGKDYKFMMYHGQLDINIPYSTTEKFIGSLKWNGQSSYRYETFFIHTTPFKKGSAYRLIFDSFLIAV